MKRALEWWKNLSNIESIGFEREYGYYGHDQGVTEDEILRMYKGENIIDEWLEKHGDPEITKQVEREAEDICAKEIETVENKKPLHF
jgi:hypothetical protein